MVPVAFTCANNVAAFNNAQTNTYRWTNIVKPLLETDPRQRAIVFIVLFFERSTVSVNVPVYTMRELLARGVGHHQTAVRQLQQGRRAVPRPPADGREHPTCQEIPR